MKKQLLLSGVFLMLTAISFGQQKEVQKREVMQKVKMTEENGEKKLIVKTNDNGTITEEVYVGDEADKKLEEIQGSHKELKEDQKKVEVKMEEVNGEKKLTVIENKGGVKTEEVYFGEEADIKLKELEGNRPVRNVEKKVRMQQKMKVQQKKSN